MPTKKSDPILKERKKRAARASRLRAKKAKGKALSAAERADLLAWEKDKAPNGAPVTLVDTPATTPADKPTTTTTPNIAADKPKTDKPKTKAASEPKPAPKLDRPPPDPPPKIQVLPTSKSGDWRDKWRVAADDRESTVLYGATPWRNALAWMIKEIGAMGGKSLVSETMLADVVYPSIVLTIDDLLPPDFTVKPHVITAFSSSAVTVQWFFLSKSAKGKRAKEEEAETIAVRDQEPETAERKPADVIKIKETPVDTKPIQQERAKAASAFAASEKTRDLTPGLYRKPIDGETFELGDDDPC